MSNKNIQPITSNASLVAVTQNFPFLKGYIDKRKEQPFDNDYETWCEIYQRNYESGRHFAIFLKSMNLSFSKISLKRKNKTFTETFIQYYRDGTFLRFMKPNIN